VPCKTCGSLFDPWPNRGGRLYCTPGCNPQTTRSAREARRRGASEEGDADITAPGIAARDGWSCWLCGGLIDPDLKHRWANPDPLAASIDHVLPISMGGVHVWGNVRLAHYICNVTRGARMVS
jgi:5-methylcytosine-specific restriction endonuclease McrA